jgi:hypothetical protein|tara:strand:- start:80 stop:646 length:567 start_codon:yes stop_codon:yes gene_type:complete
MSPSMTGAASIHPPVWYCQRNAPGPGVAVGDAVGDGVCVAVGDGVCVGTGVGVGVGTGLAVEVGDSVAVLIADGVDVGVADDTGELVGDGSTVGVGEYSTEGSGVSVDVGAGRDRARDGVRSRAWRRGHHIGLEAGRSNRWTRIAPAGEGSDCDGGEYGNEGRSYAAYSMAAQRHASTLRTASWVDGI